MLPSAFAITMRPILEGVRLGACVAALLLAGCAQEPIAPPTATPAASSPATAATPAAVEPDDSIAHALLSPPLLRARSRWVPVRWADVPGWPADPVLEAWPALRAGCERPSAPWAAFCKTWQQAPTPTSDDAARAWLQAHLQPYRIEALPSAAPVAASPAASTPSANPSEGLATGYFEPLIDASRSPQAGYTVPLYAPPADLASRKPYWTRQQIDTLPAARAALRGREIAWVQDPLDALVLHIQGSGRLRFTAPDGSSQTVRMAFGGHNEQPYKSVGRWLIEQGELRLDQASWPGIKDWARRNPARLNELLWANPRYVFFREEPLPDPRIGPKGAQGVPLTPGRSIAVDPQSIPYGTPVWLDTTEPLSSTPLRRLVLAQDTGSAITGAVRADVFWGWGLEAEQLAGRMKQPLRMFALWPKP